MSGQRRENELGLDKANRRFWRSNLVAASARTVELRGRRRNEEISEGKAKAETLSIYSRSLSLTLLEQALKLQSSDGVLRESGQLCQVGRVVGDCAVEEPVGPRQVFRGILCRSRGTELARGRRESALERGLRGKSDIGCAVEAVGELVMVMVLCLLRGL